MSFEIKNFGKRTCSIARKSKTVDLIIFPFPKVFKCCVKNSWQYYKTINFKIFLTETKKKNYSL